VTEAEDAARVAALQTYDVLQDGPRGELVALVDVAARLAGVPMATINLITADEQRQVATVGFEAAVCSREDSMCDTTLKEGRAILLADASQDDRFRDNPFTTGVIGNVRFYASHPLVTPEGIAIGTLCVFDEQPHEITPDLESGLAILAERVVDLLQLELNTRRLAVANSQLATSNERLGAFAGQISHDLKNPLSAIAMSLEMARDEVTGDDPVVASLLERASRGADRMNSMIGDLLAFARGGAAPEIRDVDLDEVMREVLEDLHDTLEGATVTADGLPVVHGDPVQLRALVQNLVANALKFVRPGVPPQVDVAATRTALGWWVTVADNGPGVPLSEWDRVFEPFNRVDKSVPGTGIGLSTCKRIVEAHGGRIGLSASPTGGALVWFELPD
jgi:signal transduction histidine kinase